MKSSKPCLLSEPAILFPALLAIVMVSSLHPLAQAAPTRVVVQEVAKLTADDAQAGDWLSFFPTFTDDGEFLVVGASGHDLGPARSGDPNDTTGAAYIFRRDPDDPSMWAQFQKLRPDDLSIEGGTDNLRGLVVIAIIGLLAGMLLPALAKAKARAKIYSLRLQS